MDSKETKEKYKSNKYQLISLALAVHILLLFAVFDVYFSSPLDHGMTPVKSTDRPPAKRLVLMVADGLRAEAMYNTHEDTQTPFLAGIKKKGSWGVAHTRVPTESRPGHVALLAGIYEDPSAIFKGWKANPVYFDSVVNQSVNAWCWGSPDIINLFKSDSTSVHLYSYDAQIEDFGKNNTESLDIWVYNEVERFMTEKVQSCKESCDEFKDGNLFFLHLLGIDTAGHAYKPNSKEYTRNIKVVGEIARNVTKLFETTFKDDSTAYVFTADHGMTDWGSHGSGSNHETEVPVVAWGAGIKVTEKRQDLNQIDLAPLLSTLIGINIPINSLGILPTEYLDMEESNLLETLSSNILQLSKIFDVKRLRIKNNAMIYIPFKDITISSVYEKIMYLNNLDAQSFEEAKSEYIDFMKLLIQGINYYHNYYQYPILIAVSIGFIEWIIFLSFTVLSPSKPVVSSKSFKNSFFITSMLIVILLCFKQRFPITYYLYFAFPVMMSYLIFDNLSCKCVVESIQNVNIKQTILNTIFYLLGLELLVYGFFSRSAFTILMHLVGIWVFLSKDFSRNTTFPEKCVWMSTCFVLSVFPMMPVMRTRFSLSYYIYGTVGWIGLFIVMYSKIIELYQTRRNNANRIRHRPFYVQFICLLLAALYVLLIEYEVISSDSNIKYISWFILGIPIHMIPLTNRFIPVRSVATFFGFAPFYFLVSSNYELVFSALYVSLLCLWLLIESNSFQFGNRTNLVYYVKFENYESKDKINHDMFRRAFLFMMFIFLGFFGTGNVASLNSFDPMWVRAFLTVFSPFKMTGLIILKFCVPFIFASCIFKGINSIGRENMLKMFCIILIFSDVMVLQFLYLITNEGSWLDIGTNLSHFIVMEAFVTILLVMYAAAHILTTLRCNRV